VSSLGAVGDNWDDNEQSSLHMVPSERLAEYSGKLHKSKSRTYDVGNSVPKKLESYSCQKIGEQFFLKQKKESQPVFGGSKKDMLESR
jgi:hypothetical protein